MPGKFVQTGNDGLILITAEARIKKLKKLVENTDPASLPTKRHLAFEEQDGSTCVANSYLNGLNYIFGQRMPLDFIKNFQEYTSTRVTARSDPNRTSERRSLYDVERHAQKHGDDFFSGYKARLPDDVDDLYETLIKFKGDAALINKQGVHATMIYFRKGADNSLEIVQIDSLETREKLLTPTEFAKLVVQDTENGPSIYNLLVYKEQSDNKKGGVIPWSPSIKRRFLNLYQSHYGKASSNFREAV